MPIPGEPMTVTSRQARAVTASSNAARRRASSRVAADERRVVSAGTLLGRRGGETSRKARTGPALPLSSSGATGSRRHVVAHEPLGLLPDQHLAVARRLLEPRGDVDRVADQVAVLDRSTTTSPVLTPVRRPRRTPQSRSRSSLSPSRPATQRVRRAHRPQRVVLAHDRRPQDGHHGVADELRDAALVGLDRRARRVVEAVHHAAQRLGVEPLLEAGRPDQVREDDRHGLAHLVRPPAGAGGRARSRRRTARPARSSFPQAAQAAESDDPHAAQKRASSRFSSPHCVHSTGFRSLFRARSSHAARPPHRRSSSRRGCRIRRGYGDVVEQAADLPNVELRGDKSGGQIVVLSFPYDHAIVAAVRGIPHRSFDWDTQGVARAGRRLGRGARRGRAGTLPRAGSQRAGVRVAARDRLALGGERLDRPPRRPRLVGADDTSREGPRGAARRIDRARRAHARAAHARRRGRAARAALGALRRRRRALPDRGRDGQLRAPGPAGADPARRRRAPGARGALGPGGRDRVREPARRRGGTPRPARPVDRRAARRVHRAARRRGRAAPRCARSRRCASSTSRRRPRSAARARPRATRSPKSRPCSAASSSRSSGPACATRSTRGAASWPTSRASARPSRRSPRWRRPTPTRRSSSARRR